MRVDNKNMASEILIASFFQRLDHVNFPSSPISPSVLRRILIPGHSLPSLLPLHHLLRPDLRYRLRMHYRPPNNPGPKRHRRHARPLQQRHLRSPIPLQQSLLLLLRAQLLLLRQCCLQRHPLLHPTSTRPPHLPHPRLQPNPTLPRQRNRHHLQHAISRRQQLSRTKVPNPQHRVTSVPTPSLAPAGPHKFLPIPSSSTALSPAACHRARGRLACRPWDGHSCGRSCDSGCVQTVPKLGTWDTACDQAPGVEQSHELVEKGSDEYGMNADNFAKLAVLGVSIGCER